jgi:hypothetical protein
VTETDWATLAEVVSAIGVIVTLVYLAIQVHQNTRQMKTQGLQLALRQFLVAFENITASTDVADLMRRGLNDFDALSRREQGVFHSKMHSMLVGFNAVWNLYKDGLVPKYELDAMRGSFLSLLGSAGGLSWWRAFKHVPPPVLTEYLDGFLAGATVANAATSQFPWLRPDE